jgi:signal transduction histidine kinase
MAKTPLISPNIRRSLLIVEVTILVANVWVNLNTVESQSSPLVIWKIGFFSGAIAILGILLPIHGSVWQRRIYLFSAIAILATASHHKISFDSLTMLYLLKGCFLLPRREVILGTICYGVVVYTSLWLRLPTEFELIRNRGIEPYLDPIRIVSNNIFLYLGSCTFVLLLGNVWVEEQKARRKAEALSEQVESLAADLERNRIARDIHDSLGHSLTTLDVQIELAQRLQATNPERSQKSLDIAKILTRQCLDDVRRALRTMQRSQFDLTEAVGILVEQVTQNQSFQIKVEMTFPELSLQTSYQLYCIIQESLTNIQKYAQASQVAIKGTTIDSGISLKIYDNGKGFDQSLSHSGFGLRNMHERIQCLAGRFVIQSEINQGTRIEIFIPI